MWRTLQNKKSTLIPVTAVFIIFIWLGIYFFLLPVDNGTTSGVTSLYYVDNISVAHQYVIEKFNEKYKGKIKVVPINLPFEEFSTNDRKELLARTLRSKNQKIDLFTVDVIWNSRFSRWSEPLEGLFTLHEREQILPEAMQSCYYNNILHSVPFYIDVGVLYFRRDKIESIPGSEQLLTQIRKGISWELLKRIHKKYFPNDQDFLLFCGKPFEGLICIFSEIVHSMGGNLFIVNDDSILVYNDKTIKALNILYDAIHREKLTLPVITRYDEMGVYQMALRGDGVFFFGWPGLHKQLNGMDKKNILSYVEVAPVPRSKTGVSHSVLGGWNFMISKFSRHKKEASLFIKFALEPEIQKKLYELAGYIPIHKAVYQDSAFLRKNPDLTMYLDFVRHGVPRPQLVEYTEISDIFSRYLNMALEGKLSPEEALKQAQAEINRRIDIGKSK